MSSRIRTIGSAPASCPATCTGGQPRPGCSALPSRERRWWRRRPPRLVTICEELHYAGGASGLIAALFTAGIALPHIVAAGDPAQIDRCVRPTLQGELIGALAITEPDGGSDVAAIRTTAERDGDHFVVNGAKTFITTGCRADFVTTAVRTGDPGGGGLSLLVVEKGTPGFTVGRTLEKMGWHCSDTAELSFADVRVPVANLVGAENTGFAQIAQHFVSERLLWPCRLTRSGTRPRPRRRVVPRARDVRPAADRRQIVQHTLAEMPRRVEVARAYTRDVACRSRRQATT